MSSGPTIPRRFRKSPTRDVSFDPAVLRALDAHCERTGETRSAVIDRALRVELGLQPAGSDYTAEDLRRDVGLILERAKASEERASKKKDST